MAALEKVTITCARGTENALYFELKNMGFEKPKKLSGAVTVMAKKSDVGRINMWTRIGHKVLIAITEFGADSVDELKSCLTYIEWEKYIPKKCTFAVSAALKNAALDHTLYAEQLVKDSVNDRFLSLSREAPIVDKKTPASRIVIFWNDNKVYVSLDSSGQSLSHRGYRPSQVRAPLRESMAAAILAIAHADITRPFYDPCCGSGTLAVEQAWRSLDRAPGLERRFAVDRWPGDGLGYAHGFELAREEARDRLKNKLEAPIFLSDWHREAVLFAEESIEVSGMNSYLEVQRIDARARDFDAENPMIFSNLPFGERLEGKGSLQLDGFYRSLGDKLRDLENARIVFLTSYPRAFNLLDLGEAKRWNLQTGPIKVALRKWDNSYQPRG